VIKQAALYVASAEDVLGARLRVAGRPVAFRTVLAAVRAGVQRVAVPTVLRSPDFEAALATSPRARAALVWLDAPDGLRSEPTLLLPAAALVPAAALARLVHASPGAVLAESLTADAPVVGADVDLLDQVRTPLVTGALLGDTLVHTLKARDVESVTGESWWYVRVLGPRTAAEAERRLYGDLRSPIDTRLDLVLHRRLSRPISRTAVALGIGPNWITIASGVCGLAAAGVFALGTPAALVVGLLVYLLAVVLDHADGEVARLTLTESALGEWLDAVVDTVVHTTLALALGVAALRLSGGGLPAGVVAAVGILVGGFIGKIWPPAPSTASRNLLDRLTSRDGFYAMLCLFVLLGVFRPPLLPSLMLIVAAGTHVYWLARTLVLIARRA
jgi:phosphatidylglycerophosphate synthase